MLFSNISPSFRVDRNMLNSGAYHTHGKDPEWVTARFYDKNEDVICHQKLDGSMWYCMHVFRNPRMNSSCTERPTRFWSQDFSEARKAA